MTQYTDANKDLTKCGKIKEEFRGHTVPTIEQSRAAAVRFSSHYYSTYKGKFTPGRLVLSHHHLYTAN